MLLFEIWGKNRMIICEKIKVVKEKLDKIWIIVFLTLLPMLCCVIMCISQGISINDIYLPDSKWNDELIYFKWVEGTNQYGVAQGYFGYNESHANYLNFGTWSPLLNIFWIIFAKIFGWSFHSPIYCNILLMSIAMFLFSIWVKPDKYQAIAIALLFSTHATLTRFMLSGLSEISCFFPLVLMTGIILKKEKEKWSIIVMYGLVFGLTLMRPYYILLFFIPCYYWYIFSSKKGRVVGISFLLFTFFAGAYIWVNKNLCAPYFSDLFRSDWLELIFNDFGKGIFHLWYVIGSSGKTFLQYVGNGLTGDIVQCGWCATYFVLLLWIIFRFYSAYRNRQKSFGLYAYGMAVFLIMLIAVFLLFDIYNGSKHLVGFTLMGILIMAIVESLNDRTIMFGILLLYLFTMKATSEYEWSLPALSWSTEQEIEYGKSVLMNALIVDTKADRWDNTIIWTLTSKMKWQDLYACPSGVGINICSEDYVNNNYFQIKSKYLATSIGEKTDNLCKQNGAELLAEFGEIHIWRLRV